MKNKKLRKKISALAAVLLTAVMFIAAPGFTQRVYAEDIAIDATNFPDENFRTYISANADGNGDGVLSPEEISSTTSINVRNKSISDLKGIEFFTSLTELNCYQNQLTSLDVSKNTALINIKCDSNRLTSLDVSKNTALKNFECDSNQLTSLDVSRNTALVFFSCTGNQLTTINMGSKPELIRFHCDSNNLSNIDMSQCTALIGMSCAGNPLTSLDLSKCTRLQGLDVYETDITSLDFSCNSELVSLDCPGNRLTSLDLSNCTALENLDCRVNQLASLDLSNCTALKYLDCGDNQLASLDVSNCPALINLCCNNNSLKRLDLEANTSLSADNATFDSQSGSVFAAYRGGKLAVDLANDVGLDMDKVSDVSVTGGTYSNGTAYFDIPVADEAKISYSYSTKPSIQEKMDVTLILSTVIVTFDTDGESAVELQAVEAGTSASRPAKPVKAGYHLIDWYTDPSCADGTEFDFATPLTEDITLYAKWEEHTFGPWTHTGSHTHECTVCGYSETEECTFGDWQVTKQPTAADNGKKERTCSKCGYVETAEIAALGTTASENSDIPQTGESGNAVLWAAMMLATAGAGLLTIRMRKER